MLVLCTVEPISRPGTVLAKDGKVAVAQMESSLVWSLGSGHQQVQFGLGIYQDGGGAHGL